MRSSPIPCAASRYAARSGGFRVMLEPLAHDGPGQTYDATLREQHADGMVISGPRVDDDGAPGPGP